MKKQLIALLIASLVSGCAAVSHFWDDVRDHSNEGTRKTASGGPAGPTKKQSKGKSVPGTTADQALFRRALLSLKPDRETVASKKGRQLLHRLINEHPSSPWAAPAAPVRELIEIADELTKENRELEATNESLTRQIEELNHSIEQMKHLETELEKSR